MFNKEFYEKIYLRKFSSHEEAYNDWKYNLKVAEINNQPPLLGEPIKENGITYTSQLGQDYYIINKIFNKKKNGFFIEFGACDGLFLSNTYVLEKYFNWTGICAEPDKLYYDQLINNRKCNVSNSLIYNKSDIEVEFSVQEHRETSGIKNHKSNHFYNPTTIKLKTITLDELLQNFNAPKIIDYLSIDTEGSELEILKAFSFDKYDINYISIEHGGDTNYQKSINNFLLQKGYKLSRNCWWDDEYILEKK